MLADIQNMLANVEGKTKQLDTKTNIPNPELNGAERGIIFYSLPLYPNNNNDNNNNSQIK